MKNTASISDAVSHRSYRESVARSLEKCFAPLTPEELQTMREKEKPQEPAPLPRPRRYGRKGTPARTPAEVRLAAHESAAAALAEAQAAMLTVRESLFRLAAEPLDDLVTRSLQNIGTIRCQLSESFDEAARAAAAAPPPNPYRGSADPAREAPPR